MSNTKDTNANREKLERRDKILRETDEQFLRKGVYGKVGIEYDVKDGTIVGPVRRKAETTHQ